MVPLTATATAPILLKTTVQVAKSDAALDVPNNALPIVPQAAKPLVRALVLTVAAPCAEGPVNHLVVALVPMSPLVQVAHQVPVLLLVGIIASGRVRWHVAQIACRVALLHRNEPIRTLF